MARVKTARITRKRHKKILKQAKGYYGAKHYRVRMANQAVLKSLSYALIEESGFNIFINTDEEGVYFYPKYKIDAFINDEQIVEYFESFSQVLDFIKKKFPKVKLSSKDTIARLKKKITKVYKINDDEDFYLNIHRFSSMYPF